MSGLFNSFLWFSFVCPILFSCQNSGPKKSEPDPARMENEYQKKLSQVLCHEHFSCSNHLDREYASEGACVTHLQAIGIADKEELRYVLLAGGTFDHKAFDQCMKRRLQRRCSEPRSYDVDCDTYLTGVLNNGEPCKTTGECANGFCHITTCTCTPRKGTGEPCRHDRECVPGRVCSRATARCAVEERFPGPDETCGSDIACLHGHACSTLDGSGVCIPLPQTGEPCISTSIVNCNHGFCQTRAVECAPNLFCWEGLCRPVYFSSEEGEACNMFPCDISKNLRCRVISDPQYAHVCVRVQPAGTEAPAGTGACTLGSSHYCCGDDSYWRDEFCHPLKRVGEPCTDSRECFSRCAAVPDKPHLVCKFSGCHVPDDTVNNQNSVD